MKAATETPAICPRGLIMQVEIKILIAQAERRYYFPELVEYRRHLKGDYFTGASQELFRPEARILLEHALTLPMSAKRPKSRWAVYEQRKGKFIHLSRLFTTRPQAEKERDRLEAAFTYKKVSFGVGVVAKE